MGAKERTEPIPVLPDYARASQRDILLKQADDAIATARRLQNELCETMAAARAQCRRMEHWETLQLGLSPVVAISLRVRARVSEQGVR
ncbi:hypothetical protein ACVW0W_004716 [Bradyrhizobium sp. USDA 4469]